MQLTGRISPGHLMAALALAAVALHPAAAQRAGEGGGTIDIKSGRFAAVFAEGPSRAPDTVAMSADRVFERLPAVFAALPVPLSVVDSASRVMGALRIPVRRPIGGDRLSMLLECGTGSYGPNAERYAVQLTLMAAVRAIDSTHSEVLTKVAGNASPNGLSTTVQCGSTGRLEERFSSELRKQMGVP